MASQLKIEREILKLCLLIIFGVACLSYIATQLHC